MLSQVLRFQKGVTSIGDWTFSHCSSLNSIVIPNRVTSIGKSAFYGCSRLTNTNIPESVARIGAGAFSECDSLNSVSFKTTSGWAALNEDLAKRVNINSSDLANTSTAATYLKSTYATYHWSRS